MASAQSGSFAYSQRLQGDNIRLLSLLPGKFKDDIHLELWETPLPRNNGTAEAQVAYRLEDIRKTLPAGWLVEVNLEGVLFYARNKPSEEIAETSYTLPDLAFKPGEEIAETSYTHPDATFRLDDFVSAPAEQPPKGQIPEFEALSYVWGSNTDGGLVHVTERSALSSSGTLRIGKNLAKALRRLRQKKSARTLWIDALCIDQSSKEEKSTQVARMSCIYKSATRVVVWLGNSGPDISGDLSQARILMRFRNDGTHCEVSRDGILYPHPTNKSWMAGNQGTRMMRMDVFERGGLDSFVNCQWFNRVWTLQEIQLAPEALFYWGDESITWKLLRRAMLVTDWGIAVTDTVSSRLDIICRSAVHLSDFTFRDIIETIRGKQCADPRDKLYGIKGLVHPGISEQITVDYTKPWEEVYRDVLLAHADLTKSFPLWHGCSAATNLTGFASWVPDWSASLGPDTYFIPNDALASHFTLGHFTYEAPNRLTVAAVHIGTVVAGSVEEVRDEQGLRRVAEQALTSEDRLRALPKILCLGNSRTEFTVHVEALRRLTQASEMDDLDIDDRIVLGEILRSQQGRTLATLTVSEGDSFASARGDKTAVQEGDEAYVVLGCPVPLLLRPMDNNTIQMVGDCYVEGYMNGEAVVGRLPAPWTAAPSDEGAFAQIPRYDNNETGELSTDDPRLDGSLDDWEVIGAVFDDGASAIYQRLRHQPKIVKGVRERRMQETSDRRKHLFKEYRNRVTGEEVVGDPRLNIDSLERRGVDVQHITLV